MTNRVVRLLRDAVRDPVDVTARLQLKTRLAGLRLVNRLSRRSIVGTGPVVVSVTSYGHRVESVYYSLESIAAGTVRPQRLILWLDDEALVAHPPMPLRRLATRGLEILHCRDFGPHKKQYPYALMTPGVMQPLATADDDVLYPRRWLADLMAARALHPDDINAMRTHSIGFDGDAIAPYRDWQPGSSTAASFRTLATGVSGVVYPPQLLAALRQEGERFLEVAPHADDIWVHAVAVRHGIRGRQAAVAQAEYPAIPGTQRGTLYRRNVIDGGNDAQIELAYGPAELDRIRRDDPRDAGPLTSVGDVHGK